MAYQPTFTDNNRRKLGGKTLSGVGTFTIPEGTRWFSVLNSSATGNVTIVTNTGDNITLAPLQSFAVSSEDGGFEAIDVTTVTGGGAEIAYVV